MKFLQRIQSWVALGTPKVRRNTAVICTMQGDRVCKCTACGVYVKEEETWCCESCNGVLCYKCTCRSPECQQKA